MLLFIAAIVTATLQASDLYQHSQIKMIIVKERGSKPVAHWYTPVQILSQYITTPTQNSSSPSMFLPSSYVYLYHAPSTNSSSDRPSCSGELSEKLFQQNYPNTPQNQYLGFNPKHAA